MTTLGGRRRLLPDILSANGQAFALARRQAINTVIQGSAADIIKLAMLAVAHDAELRRMDAAFSCRCMTNCCWKRPKPRPKRRCAGGRPDELGGSGRRDAFRASGGGLGGGA